MDALMTPADVESHFTRSDGSFAFARWGRPIVPIVFGVDDASLSVIKGAVEAVVALAGHKMAETDPELGANLLFFFVAGWDELLGVKDLGEMIPDLPQRVARLQAAGARQYRAFRFDADGAIRACFVFVRMDEAMAQVPAEDLALAQAAQALLLWSDQAFAERSPLGRLEDGRAVLRPEVGAMIKAAYDPLLPNADGDKSFALRLYARIAAGAA